MKAWWLGLSLLLLSGLVHAQDELSVEQGWIRWVPPVSSNSAAYFMLHNASKTDATLIAAESEVAKAVELHTVVQEGELMRMQPLETLTVPAEDCVLFKPGSHHVMLIGLKKPLEAGQQVPMTLRFADGSSLQLTLTVKNEGDDDHAHHQH